MKTKRMNPYRLALFLLAVILLAGCSHTLEIKNLDAYRIMSMTRCEKPTSIGIASTDSDIYVQRLVKATGTALSKYTTGELVFPYLSQGDKKVDVIANVAVRPEYKSSGWNFLINWPGFLVFTPAWHGYVYKVNYNVDILLSEALENKKIDSFTIPIELDIRHADFDRTWTEIGWLEWGITPLIGGIIFAGKYDPDVTPLAMEKIEQPTGDYIAQKIVSKINAYKPR